MPRHTKVILYGRPHSVYTRIARLVLEEKGVPYAFEEVDVFDRENEIPILLQNFKIGLRVSERSTDEFLVQVVGYEKDGPTWHQIMVPPPEFGGKLGIPAEYVWESGGIKLDLAIVIGIHEL
jgi:hypothetical protein